jgi:hypothetical protein
MSENDATAGAMYRTVFDVLGEGLMVWGPDGQVVAHGVGAHHRR